MFAPAERTTRWGLRQALASTPARSHPGLASRTTPSVVLRNPPLVAITSWSRCWVSSRRHSNTSRSRGDTPTAAVNAMQRDLVVIAGFRYGRRCVAGQRRLTQSGNMRSSSSGEYPGWCFSVRSPRARRRCSGIGSMGRGGRRSGLSRKCVTAATMRSPGQLEAALVQALTALPDRPGSGRPPRNQGTRPQGGGCGPTAGRPGPCLGPRRPGSVRAASGRAPARLNQGPRRSEAAAREVGGLALDGQDDLFVDVAAF